MSLAGILWWPGSLTAWRIREEYDGCDVHGRGIECQTPRNIAGYDPKLAACCCHREPRTPRLGDRAHLLGGDGSKAWPNNGILWNRDRKPARLRVSLDGLEPSSSHFAFCGWLCHSVSAAHH